MANTWVSLCILLKLSTAWGSLVEDRLLANMSKVYNKNARPVEEWTTALKVGLDIDISQVVDINERTQDVTLILWLEFNWTDVRLGWDPEEYEGLPDVRTKMQDIWKPDIVLYTGMGKFVDLADGNDLMMIEWTGQVYWSFLKLVKSTCALSVDYFPWDTQVCPISFGSWTYSTSKVDLRNRRPMASIRNYDENAEWTLLEMPCRRQEKTYYKYGTGGTNYSVVTYYLMVERKPLYYLFNLILPCIVIQSTALLAFSLPPESGEKVSLNVTVLLSLTVMLLMMANYMPTQSFSVPLLGQYLGVVILILMVSTACTVFVIKTHHRGSLNGEVPPWIRRLVFHWMAGMVHMRGTVSAYLKESATNNYKMPSKMDTDTSDVIMMGHSEPEVPFTHFRNISPNAIDVASIDLRPRKSVKNSASITQNTQSVEDQLRHIQLYLQETRNDALDRDKDTQVSQEWILVATIMDRVFLLVLLVMCVLACTTVLLQYRYNPRPYPEF